MKKLIAGILTALMLTTANAVDVTGNAGYNSNYVFRGVEQDKSSANGGIDIEQSGFYLGTWAASVEPGLEVDVYGGYGGEFKLGGEVFSYSAGATVYLYTDDFDDTYQELNFTAGWGFLSGEVSIGEYDNFGGPTQDYIFYALTAEHRGLYATVGAFGQDFDGWYAEAGYGDTLSVADTDLFDWTVSIVRRGDDLPSQGAPDDTYANFAISKSFAIFQN